MGKKIVTKVSCDWCRKEAEFVGFSDSTIQKPWIFDDLGLHISTGGSRHFTTKPAGTLTCSETCRSQARSAIQMARKTYVAAYMNARDAANCPDRSEVEAIEAFRKQVYDGDPVCSESVDHPDPLRNIKFVVKGDPLGVDTPARCPHRSGDGIFRCRLLLYHPRSHEPGSRHELGVRGREKFDPGSNRWIPIAAPTTQQQVQPNQKMCGHSLERDPDVPEEASCRALAIPGGVCCRKHTIMECRTCTRTRSLVHLDARRGLCNYCREGTNADPNP